MSGVDKLEITLNTHPESNIVLGVLLKDIIGAAPSINYSHGGTSYRKECKNAAIKLTSLEGDKGDIIIEYQNRKLPYGQSRKHELIATKIIVNPNHFAGWRSLNHTMQTLNETIPEPLITSGYINRIDFNVDIDMNPVDFRKSINVKSKQSKKTYFDSMTGRTETVYCGKGSDIILFYDRHQLFDDIGRGDLLTSTQARMRIERQIRKPRHITKLCNLPSHPTYSDVHSILSNVANGNISPLNKVVMGSLYWPDNQDIPTSQAIELGRFYHAAESVCYGYARRKFKGESILDRFTFSPYSNDEQPPAKLAEAVSAYLAA